MPALLPARSPRAPEPGARIPQHNRACYGCGDEHRSGMGIEMFAGEGLTVRGEVEVSALMQGAPGLAHGGLLSVAMDEICGSLNWLLAEPAVTARLECDYLQPVRVGHRLFLSAHVVSVEGRKIRTRGTGRIDSPDGPVAVRADALFVTVPPEHFDRHVS